jgi:tripartite-type tricarboxylate transporter receptor subunit TctC
MVPKKTPDSVIRILHNVFKKGMEEQSFKDYIKKSGWVADYKDPIDMKKELDGYYSLFGEIFLKLKLK